MKHQKMYLKPMTNSKSYNNRRRRKKSMKVMKKIKQNNNKRYMQSDNDDDGDIPNNAIYDEKHHDETKNLKKKKRIYTYRRRKWQLHRHDDLEENRERIKELLKQQQVYMENMQLAKQKLKEEEDKDSLYIKKIKERNARLKVRKDKRRTYESSMYTNKKFEEKYRQRRTFQGQLNSIQNIKTSTISEDEDHNNDNIYMKENARRYDRKTFDHSSSTNIRTRTKRKYYRRKRQQSLPSLHSQSSTTITSKKHLASSKSSTVLKSKNNSSSNNTTRSKRMEATIKRRAQIIKDLEEAQKWSTFISRQIKPLERSIDRNEEQLQRSWLCFSKILFFYNEEKKKLIQTNTFINAAKYIQIWWRYSRRKKFMMAMKKCINVIKRQRGRFKLSIRCWQRSRFARMVREFIVDTSRSRFAYAMKRLRWNICQAQRASRAFLKCKRARIHALFRVWISCERNNRAKLLELQKEISKKKKKHNNNLENIVEGKFNLHVSFKQQLFIYLYN